MHIRRNSFLLLHKINESYSLAKINKLFMSNYSDVIIEKYEYFVKNFPNKKTR
jgi:uncharacterized protein YutD